jgi:hypothetical protein
MTLDDASGGQKYWTFSTTGAVPWRLGLVTSLAERPAAGQAAKRRHDYTWALDSDPLLPNPYIATVATTLDQNTPNQAQMKREQVVDTHGNQTVLKVYDYNSLTTPKRTWTHTYTYQTDPNHAQRYIFNRLKTSQVADEQGNETTLVSNSYDQYLLADLTGLRQHDTLHYGAGFSYRAT